MQRQSERRLSARKRAANEFKAGRASKYIREFNVRPGNPVLLALRKSGCERRRNLEDQEANPRQVVESAGGIVVGVYKYVGSGFDSSWIIGAAAKARRLGAKILLAETTDRFVRNKHYHSVKCPDVQATEEQLAELAEFAGDRVLMTHLHPDASPAEVRGYQSARGQRQKRRKGGRPRNRTPGYKKRKYEEKKSLVMWLYKRGWSLRRIANKPMVGVAKSTLSDWIQKLS